jgi:hypothetical protein
MEETEARGAVGLMSTIVTAAEDGDWRRGRQAARTARVR